MVYYGIHNISDGSYVFCGKMTVECEGSVKERQPENEGNQSRPRAANHAATFVLAKSQSPGAPVAIFDPTRASN